MSPHTRSPLAGLGTGAVLEAISREWAPQPMTPEEIEAKRAASVEKKRAKYRRRNARRARARADLKKSTCGGTSPMQ